ncbi:MAG: hypothetical protein ABSH22_18630, partial [Tepidisphaeraceae bacterium]
MIRFVRIASLMVFAAFCLAESGCSSDTEQAQSIVAAPAPQLIRVRLVEDAQIVGVSATANPVMSVQSMQRPLIL